MNVRNLSQLLAWFGAVALGACSATSNPAASTSPTTPPSDGGSRADDDASPSPPDGSGALDAAPDVGGDAAPEGYCPTAKAGESVYCQDFDAPRKPIGAWSLSGEPLFEDGGAPREDRSQFWSPPNSRHLYSAGPGFGDLQGGIGGSAAGPLPVK